MNMVSRRLFAIFPLVAAMLVQSVTAAIGNDFEIPLKELKKVEKKKPKKTETRKRKERKKTETTGKETPREALEIVPAPMALETAQRAAEPLETPDSARISHEPYSYVVPGKYIVIKAVISREAVRSVRCRFRSLDSGGYASVAMVKAPGSQFTYVATLPALEPGATVIRYRFMVIDASGNQTYSQEFATPVKPTSVMPAWQRDPDKEPVRGVLEDLRQPLEGFSGVIMENADRK